MDFTIPSLPPVVNNRHPPFEAPSHILPSKVHSHSPSGVVNAAALTHASTAADSSPSSSCTISRDSSASNAPFAILDFGYCVAGLPVIQVASVERKTDAPVVLDISFSEGYPGITRPDGDGPFPFSAGADTMRRTRFRITEPGFYEALNVQGSQRWLKVELLSPDTSVSLSLAGFRPITSNVPLDELPGYFDCSDSMLSELWGYGARTLQLNCIPERTVPPPWQIAPDMGILIDSQRCNSYGWGSDWTDYELTVKGMVVEGGLAWTVRVNRGRPGLLFQLNVDGEKAVLELWHGYYNKPQITLIPQLMQKVELPVPVKKESWITIRTVVVGSKPIDVFFDEVLVGTFEQAKDDGTDRLPFDATGGEKPPPPTPNGSVGLGAGQDQVCRFKDLKVISLPDKDTLYSSSLKNPAVLSDFGIGWNPFPYIFDGAKRDRYAWTADLIIGAPTLYYSTAGYDFVRGNIEASILRFSEKNPLLPGGVPPGRQFEREANDTMFNVLTMNYSLYLILVIYDYWMYSADNELVARILDKMVACLDYIETKTDSRGLVKAEGFEAGDYDYYNGLQTGISTKRNVLYALALRNVSLIASSQAIANKDLSERLSSRSSRTASAINEHLLAPSGDYYITTESRRAGLAQETQAWLIRSSIAPSNIHSSMLQQMRQKLCGPDSPVTLDRKPPLSYSPDTVDPSPPPVISPIMSGSHVVAAFEAGDINEALKVMRGVWAPMCDTQSEHFTGTTWEFMNPDGTPFKDQFCSYAQLFSPAPTFVLSRYVLGVEPIEPGFARFKVAPKVPVKKGEEGDEESITWAQGRIPTPGRGLIEVRWQTFEKGWRLFCTAPQGLTGDVILPEGVRDKAKRVFVNGEEMGSVAEKIQVGGTENVKVDIQVLYT